MTPLAPIYLAICGLVATSAFVLQPHSIALSSYRSHAFLLHVGNAVKQDGGDSAERTSPRKIADEPQERLLNSDKFLGDMDQALSGISSKNSVTSSSSFPTWKFQGHDIFCQVSLPDETNARESTKLPTVILIHGFGCCTVYWRETVEALTNQGYTVHAIDLLGQGMSAKPIDTVEYSTNLWAQQVDAYARENLADEDNIVLLGNSMGSLVALIAAAGDFAEENPENCYIRQHIAGIGMFNCGIGMNIHNIVKDPKWNPVQRFLLNLTFDVLESLVFSNVALLTWILDKVVTRDLLRNTLEELYKCAPNPKEKVDAKLIDSFYLPTKQKGSAQVLSQILTNNAGLTPIELHAKHESFLKSLPIHLVWGAQDEVVPLNWQVGQFYTALAAEEDNAVTMDVVHGGHILFDEVPDIANGPMLGWLTDLPPNIQSLRRDA